MHINGTIVNGEVRLDQPDQLPEGTRVQVEPLEDVFEHPHPLAPYDREKEIA